MTTRERAARLDRPAEVLRSAALDCLQLDRRAPAAALDDIVEYYWIVHWTVPPGEERIQDVVTHPCLHLTAERDRAMVTGVVTRCFQRVLVGSGRVVGVRFRPAGFATLWSQSMSLLTDQELPAFVALGDEAADELAALGATPDVDDAIQRMDGLLNRLRGPSRPDARSVDEAVDHIVAHPDVTRTSQLANQMGVSPRTLQRRFERYLGVGPKWVIQRRRVHEALDEIEYGRELDWCALAARLGFADQAHFVKAFTDLVGRPPSRYERAEPRRA